MSQQNPKPLFTYVRAIGALLCILTINVIIVLAHLNVETPTPRWSIYLLIIFSGGLLGLDALVNAPWANGGGKS